MIVVLKLNAVLEPSANQPVKVYPSLVGASGSVTFSPSVTVAVVMSEPFAASKETVYVWSGFTEHENRICVLWPEGSVTVAVQEPAAGCVTFPVFASITSG